MIVEVFIVTWFALDGITTFDNMIFFKADIMTFAAFQVPLPALPDVVFVLDSAKTFFHQHARTVFSFQ